MNEDEIKIKIDDGIARFFTRFGGIFSFFFSFTFFLTSGSTSRLVSGTENEIVVS